MAFALLLIGVVMIVAAVRDQASTLVCLVKGDFSGTGNFLYWIVALLVIGAIGYVEKLKPLSDAFLLLIILALFFAGGKGFFSQFQSALGNLGVGTSLANLGAPINLGVVSTIPIINPTPTPV